MTRERCNEIDDCFQQIGWRNRPDVMLGFQLQSLALSARSASHSPRSIQLAFEPRQEWNRAHLDPPARAAFVRKAKADRFAWEAAEQLAGGKLGDAKDSARQGIALIGEDDFTSLCKHYATSSFRVPLNAANDFLTGVLTPIERQS